MSIKKINSLKSLETVLKGRQQMEKHIQKQSTKSH